MESETYILAGVIITAVLHVFNFVINFRENWEKLTGRWDEGYTQEDRDSIVTLRERITAMYEVIHDKGGNGSFLVYRDPNIHRKIDEIGHEVTRLSAHVSANNSPFLPTRTNHNV